jgi:WxcM-like, C-terminal
MGCSSSSRGRGGPAAAAEAATELHASFGADVTVLAAGPFADARGSLTAFELDHFPFGVRRVFTVTNVPSGSRRGGHRHLRGTQALFCLAGRVDVELRRGDDRLEVSLVPDGVGLTIAAGIWSSQHFAVEGSELLVFASEPYDPSSYDSSPSSTT